VAPVRSTIGGAQVDNCGGRLVALAGPCSSAIGAHVSVTIVGFDHAVRIMRINPHAVVVAVGNADGPEALATIVGPIHPGVENVNAVCQTRVGKNVSVVKGTLATLPITLDHP